MVFYTFAILHSTRNKKTFIFGFNGPEITRFDTHRRLNNVIKEIQKIIRSEKEDKRNDNEKEEKIACVAECTKKIRKMI